MSLCMRFRNRLMAEGVLDRHLYRKLEQAFEESRGDKHAYVLAVNQRFPTLPRGTVLCIYSQCYQQLMKRTLPKHRRPEAIKKHYQEYLEKGDREGTELELICMAAKIPLSPVLFARIILEAHFTESYTMDGPEGSSGSVVSQYLRNPSLIPVQLLRKQITACIEHDSEYGPLAENLKHSLGYEYEFRLSQCLQKHSITCVGEKQLREQECDKTPDWKLEIPIVVSGHTIHWVESKAMFGDEATHSRYLDEQLWSYVNRFGPGMVIYWFGYQKEIDVHAEDGIIVQSTFAP